MLHFNTLRRLRSVGITDLMQAAVIHAAENDDEDYEIGDLKAVVTVCLSLMSDAQRTEFVSRMPYQTSSALNAEDQWKEIWTHAIRLAPLEQAVLYRMAAVHAWGMLTPSLQRVALAHEEVMTVLSTGFFDDWERAEAPSIEDVELALRNGWQPSAIGHLSPDGDIPADAQQIHRSLMETHAEYVPSDEDLEPSGP